MTEVNPSKEYSTRETNYAPGETTKRTYSKKSVVNVLKSYKNAVIATCILAYNPSAKLGPQGQRKAQKYPKSEGITEKTLETEINDWIGDVKAYVTPIREDGTQKVIVCLSSGMHTTWRLSFVVDATKVAWTD